MPSSRDSGCKGTSFLTITLTFCVRLTIFTFLPFYLSAFPHLKSITSAVAKSLDGKRKVASDWFTARKLLMVIVVQDLP